jgi:hypothetical protein
VAKIRDLAGEALAAAGRADALLRAEKLEDSEPEQQTVIDRLAAIRDLLPKPPESPAEKIRKLLAAERKVREEIEPLAGMNDEARAAAGTGLAERQRTHGRTATGIAEELSASPGEKEKAAADKVREAEGEIFASGEDLDRDRPEPAGEATDRAIEALEEALDLLSGKQDQQQQQQQQQNEQDEKKDEEKEKDEPQRLDAAEARRMMEEMDRDRRREEDKLFPGGGGMRVDKDW